jgi:hypothetical protein
MIGAERLWQRAGAVFASESRDLAQHRQLDDGHHRLFVESAGGLAPGVLLYGDARRGWWRVAVDAGQLERERVGDGCKRGRVSPESPDGSDVDGVVRRRLIEFLARWEALLLEDIRHVEVCRRVADRHGDDPLARLRGAREFRDARLHVGDRAHASQRRKHRLEALAIEMRMAVDQPGDHRAPMQVDDAGGRAGERSEIGAAADGGDAVALDRHCLGDRERAVDGDDPAVAKQQVTHAPQAQASRR